MAKAKPRKKPAPKKPAPKKPVAPKAAAAAPKPSGPTPKGLPQVQQTNLQPSNRQGITQEIAVADVRYGLMNAGFFIQRRYNPDDLIGKKGLQIYRQMRRDEQIKAALFTKKYATIASGWEISIEDKELQDDKQLDEIKRFIEFNLREMEGTVETYLMNCLTALDFGFSITEPVYKKLDYGEWKGNLGLKRLKVIRPEQIDFEMDQFGNLTDDGILQANKRMPASRFAIFSYRSEFGNPYGDSDLREAHRAWFVKDIVIKYMGAALERFGVPIAIATTAQTLDETTKTLLKTMLDNIQNRTGIIIPEWVKIEFPMPIQRPGDVFTGPLDKLDQWLAMSILMPSLLGMGGGQQKVGSLARSQTEFDTFLWVVEHLRNEIAETVLNERIIKVLVDLNFEVEDGIYPKFKFKELTHERKLEILDLYNKALGANAVTKTREDEEHYRSLADFPELPEEAVASGTREAQQQAMQDQVKQAGAMAKIAPAAPAPGAGGGFPPKKPGGGFPPKKKFSSREELKQAILSYVKSNRDLVVKAA